MPNKLTHGHNLMWESSRMMLPEHKEILQQHQQKLNLKTKPQLDEQEVQCLEQQLNEAIHSGSTVTLVIFGPIEHLKLTGKIGMVDHQLRQIKILLPNDELEWVKFKDIMQIE
ncbi:YolD-like family protein [Filobacillus milosensis]|uniref:YolD-like family protein n=1 Tax=Filobacillus milosensis TaxID=94137 RepID=A0A4Y8IX13_9BACI|nr:YolD-like family protein [Filobacillus milosensis]TFB23905.1 YolD-like family protein [Filobacillus milosensis]